MELHVAPMKNITDWAFRSKCLGATDSYTEMIQLRDILKKKQRALNKLDLFVIEGQRQWIQVLTNSVRDMEKLPACLDSISRSFPERSQIFGVNLNVGCPDPQIISAGQGAALIKRRKRLSDLIRAFLSNSDHPYHLSLKFRLGMHINDVKMNVLGDVINNFASIDDSRFRAPIIHFKHAQQQSDEPPMWKSLNSLLDFDFPFILNGDIKSPEDLKGISKKLDTTRIRLFHKNVRGVMIGRALIEHPRLFLEFQKT